MQALTNEHFVHFAVELSDLRDFNHGFSALVVLCRGDCLAKLWPYTDTRVGIENCRIEFLSCHILLPQIQLSGGFELTPQNFTLAVLPFRRIKKFCFAQKLPRKAKLPRGCKKLLHTPKVAQVAEHNRDRPYCTWLWSFDSFQKSLSAEGTQMLTHPGYCSSKVSAEMFLVFN